MKKKVSVSDIMTLITAILFIGLGVVTLVFSREKFERTNSFIGIFIVLSCIPTLISYFLFKGYKNPRMAPAIMFASMSLLLGIICFIAGELTIEHICVIWGALTIISCVYYLFLSIGRIRTSKLEIGSFIVTLVELVFGIFLVINLERGVTAHLIFMGISFVLKGIKVFLQYFLERKETKEKEIEKSK